MKFNTRKRRYFNIKKGGNINKEQNYLTIITPCVNQEKQIKAHSYPSPYWFYKDAGPSGAAVPSLG